MIFEPATVEAGVRFPDDEVALQVLVTKIKGECCVYVFALVGHRGEPHRHIIFRNRIPRKTQDPTEIRLSESSSLCCCDLCKLEVLSLVVSDTAVVFALETINTPRAVMDLHRGAIPRGGRAAPSIV